MPNVGICTQLPYSLILGFDWQQQVQSRCIYDSNGSLCISTPFALHLCECTQASRPSIIYITSNEPSLWPLDVAILPAAVPSLFHTDSQFIPKPSHSLTEDIIDLENIDYEHENYGRIKQEKTTEDESDALHLDGEVTEAQPPKTDSETHVEDNPVHEEYSDSNSNTNVCIIHPFNL
ncbi:hypothetical protein AVEN_111242-1 [Araneus ventricosus]|uniref:Uncharacterized protein n=1 Tax=Araneus ventricosus TaxID=182803 RepID=A0A4Y2ENN3_ARAVE|nr:hypothetical protein AVEN_111242-1 [Araneus ventricosus]